MKLKRILFFDMTTIFLVTFFVFNSCSNYSNKVEYYNPDKVDEKTIDSLHAILAKTASDPILKIDSGEIVDLQKNIVIGFQKTSFYLNRESVRLDYAIRDEIFNSGISFTELFYFWDNKPLIAYRTKMNRITGAIPGEEAFIFHNEILYEKKKDSIILSNDQIKNLALEVLKDYQKLK